MKYIILFSFIFALSVSQLYSQIGGIDTIRFEKKWSKVFKTDNTGFGINKGFSNGLSIWTDSVSCIKIIDSVTLRKKMEMLSQDTTSCGCNNKYAVKVMIYRLDLFKKNYLKNEFQQKKWDDIEIILLNFYYITGYKYESGGDYFGYRRISYYSIAQYESWLLQNKDRICIDMNSRVLYVPVNLSQKED